MHGQRNIKSHMTVAMHISYDTHSHNSCYKLRQIAEYVRSFRATHSILVREYATGLCAQHQYMTVTQIMTKTEFCVLVTSWGE